MKRIRTKTNIVSLALFWLVATSLWAPVSVLGHATSGMHSSYEQVLDLYMKQASPDSCHMDDCPGSVDKINDCQFACQYFMHTSEFSTRLVQPVETFNTPTVSYIKYPALAMLERPPKHVD